LRGAIVGDREDSRKTWLVDLASIGGRSGTLEGQEKPRRSTCLVTPACKTDGKDGQRVEDINIILDIVLALGVATIAGWIADRIGLPVLLGYVVAGMIVGPNSPGFDANEERVIQLANLGVAFMMFAIGAEFSLRELLAVRRVAVLAAAVQLPGSFAIGVFGGQLVGWSWQASVLLGAIFAISSSIVMIKILLGRGEATSPQARYAIGLMIIQDLSVVPILALLPVLEGGGDVVREVLLSLLMAGVALALVVVLGTRMVPWVLYHVARTSSRELFLLTIVVIALGTALASHKAGLSVALGAFLAGLVVSESEFDAQVVAEIIPLRDLFSTLFFVSLGMLFHPTVILEHQLEFVILSVLLVVGKTVVGSFAFLLTRINPFIAVSAGFLTAQIGEFSFVLAGTGIEHDIITSSQYAMVIGIALVSIVASPGLVAVAPQVAEAVDRLPFIHPADTSDLDMGDEPVAMRRHVIICGYGRVASVLGAALERRGMAFVVIDVNAATVRDLRARGITTIYGDAGRRAVLEHAGIAHARSVAVTVPDLVVASAATRLARDLNPMVDIVARANVRSEVAMLRSDGASEVVQPEFEAGQEFTRYVLRRMGISARELEMASTRRRSRFYAQDEDDSLYIDEVG
jgi:monovalent cation:H+ antiporter-2, CPA2 family